MVYALAFAGGLAGSLHCVGMCGVFPLTLGGRWRRQLLYHLGRLNALAFIGALSGAAGAALVAAGPVALVERALAVVAGAAMLAIGCEMLGLFSVLGTRGATLAQATVGRVLGGVMRSGSPAAPLALGVFNAFLPCQLVYAFAARAAAAASPRTGALVMLAFGLGTVPAMLALALASFLARPAVRAHLTRLAAAVVVGFGVVTLLRGLVPHLHLH
jgi:sulfite exporter TauE/SafE